MGFVKMLKGEILSPLLDFIYPPLCLACRGELKIDDHLVCESCWQSVEMVQTGDKMYELFQSRLSADGNISHVISPFYFEKDGKFQMIVHALKYEGFGSLGVEAGRFLGRLIKATGEGRSYDFLIPVPLHPLKQRERGYNQSDFICRGIQEITGIPIRTDILYRWKYTVSQTQLSLAERIENVGDAFRVDEKKAKEITDKIFVVVDDLITTGSTMNACAKELRNAGAKRVHAAALALAK